MLHPLWWYFPVACWLAPRWCQRRAGNGLAQHAATSRRRLKDAGIFRCSIFNCLKLLVFHDLWAGVAQAAPGLNPGWDVVLNQQ
jgi:hypothetical protein